MATNQNTLLSSEELEALSEGIEDGSIPSDTGYNLDARVVKHDLAAEDSALSMNLTSIEMINERFIRLFRLGLLEVLRSSPKINPAKSRFMKFGEYLSDRKPPLSVTTLRMNPLRGFSMLIIEPSIVFSSLDNFFGGFGRGIGSLPPGRLFTPTESRIISIMQDVLFGALAEAWSPLLQIECELASSEINPQFAQIAEEGELIILSRFEAELPNDERGFIDIVYTYAALKPFRDLLRSRLQTSDGDEDSDKIWAQNLHAVVGDAGLLMKTNLTELEIPLKDFEQLKMGDVLYFRRPEYARVLVNEIPCFDAVVGAAGPQAAIQIQRHVIPEENGGSLNG